MSSSTSPKFSGVIFDTNVLSLFAKINRLELLLKLFRATRSNVQLCITPALLEELSTGIQNGVAYLKEVVELVETDRIELLQLVPTDKIVIKSLPAKLAPGECEAIAICSRLNYVFVTHDRKAFNYCERVEIPALRLTTLLEGLKQSGNLTELEIQQLLG